MRRTVGESALVLLSGLAVAGGCHAGLVRYCDRPLELDAAQKDRLLRFSGVIKDTLDHSGQRVALVARSGLDLSRFDIRYSHAGVSLKASENAPWSVRQLYYACEDKKPRIFDQGMSGFVLGTEDPAVGYVSVLLFPEVAAAPLERAALDKRQALRLLNATYSANAYAFSTLYQNCNQWVIELLATAWRRATPDEQTLPLDADTLVARAAAQDWLARLDYVPTDFLVGPLVAVAAVSPWLHNDDHPRPAIEAGHYRVSMPASIEAFVRAKVSGASRVEFCHTKTHIVVHHGWTSIADSCQAGPGDTVILLP